MLSTSELTQMREAINDLLPGTAVIYTATLTSDGQGGHTKAWAASGTASCRIDPVRQREVVVGGQMREFTGWRLTLPYNVTIAETNRVRIDGTDYEVTGIDDGKSWNASTRVFLEAV